ncbi:MAG: peptidase M22, partial [Ruminococcaceae bacterium]|nr:peptidase M22 [Oscillospiraceae bacterium]
MIKCFVGIDTSNYTTSFGAVNENGEVIANIKKLLPVNAGECGLRQSDAVFAHIKNLPEILDSADAALDGKEVLAIGYSAKPRNVEGSYMPCFLCGIDAALAFKTGRGIPAFSFTHQCGHISAALTSANAWGIASDNFIAFHVSGGTTEVLLCSSVEDGFATEIVGGTRDLNAGQAIDRAGVMMDMPFPCGIHIENEAKKYCARIPKEKISVKDGFCNLSGLENLSAKLYKESKDKAKTSAFVLDFVSKTLFKMAEQVREKYGDMPIVFGGGVMSNKRIRKDLEALGNVYFATPELSSDNAVGIAELTRRKY